MRIFLFSALLLTGARITAAEPDPVRLPEVTITVPENRAANEAGPGSYGQPEWTHHRPFATTRAYIQREPWEAGFEQWWRGRFFRDGSIKHLFQEEIEVGLPHRLQADLYENWISDDRGHLRHHDIAVELRWALADWGRIPLNPALYGEWKFVDGAEGPDVFEVKLLLAEEICPRLHWALNLVYEQETGAGRATEWAASQGLSYAFLNGKLGLGVEMKFTVERERGTGSATRISAGPSLQWRPTRRIHLDVVPLIGCTAASPRVEAFIVLGIDLWPGASRYAPASLRGN